MVRKVGRGFVVSIMFYFRIGYLEKYEKDKMLKMVISSFFVNYLLFRIYGKISFINNTNFKNGNIWG
jgi:hypothetical protein